MPKINHEEYEVLKELDDKWKWIARDEDKSLWVFTEKPFRKSGVISSSCWDTEIGRSYPVLELIDEIHLFQFIQWEDENPYNIAELIEEYEDSKEYKDSLVIEYFMDKAKESEETEVKNKAELKSWFEDDKLYVGEYVKHKINQLDEPEVLSQELPVIPQFVAEWYEIEGKCSSWWNWFYKWGRDESRTELETKTIGWMQDYNEEAFVNMFLHGYEVEKEQKYLVNILDEGIGAYLIYYPKSGNYGVTGILDNSKGITRFTEQEIKDYDERYWAFAVKVEEMEE